MLARPKADPSIFGTSRQAIQSLSYVWICDRNEDNVETILGRYIEAMRQSELPSEFIVVNNGQGERVTQRILAKLNEAATPSSLINFGMPSAESTALSAAFQHASRDAIVLMPSYMQVDPDDVHRLISAAQNGLDYVASWRHPRVDAPLARRMSLVFNWITRVFSRIPLHDINSQLRVVRREVVADLPLYGDLHTYLPILAAQRGFNVGEVPVRHLEERAGKNHGVGMYLRRGLDILSLFFLMRFTQKPFRFFGGIGSIMVAAGLVTNLWLTFERLYARHSLTDRPMLILGVMLIVLGIQMFSLGLIGELIIFVNAGGAADFQVERVFESANATESQVLEGSTPQV